MLKEPPLPGASPPPTHAPDSLASTQRSMHNHRGAPLVLQLHVLLSPGSLVVNSCSGLMFSAPAGPRQDFICGCIGVQVQAHEHPSNLGHSEGNQFNGAAITTLPNRVTAAAG
jgi:hypothetical protein